MVDLRAQRIEGVTDKRSAAKGQQSLVIAAHASGPPPCENNAGHGWIGVYTHVCAGRQPDRNGLNKMAKYCIAALIILINALPLRAQEIDVVIVGLFTDQAFIEIDGRQQLLRVGDTSPEGVTLIAASSRGATLEIDG